MAILRAAIRTGSVFALAAIWGAIAGPSARAATTFSATVDRDQIGLDESVALKMSVVVDGSEQGEEPQFNAPDFDVVNEYSSTFVKSYYENGTFGMQNERQITKVLKPHRQGHLAISGISVRVGGKALRARDIAVDVGPPGAGTPPPSGFTGGGMGLRGSGQRNVDKGKGIFLRAEVSKQKVYKGEQVVVSYYLYHRVQMFNLNIEDFPQLNGFLKEELEMPVSGQPLSSETVMVGGVSYERKLLARYAAYPLQSGKLQIDPMSLKYNYYGAASRGAEDDDPFAQLFRQMAPQSGESKSEPITIEVVPLPDAGKPASFSGGVGDFSIDSAVDKSEVHANEAVTVTVKVEGRGNVAAIGEPKANWPQTVELYDTKGSAKTSKGGVGEKDFEFLLIPREPGKLQLPPLELSFFDPAQGKYITRSTAPIDVNVLPAKPGEASSAPPPASASTETPAAAPSPAAQVEELKPLKLDGGLAPEAGFHGQPGWRWLYWLCLASLVGFIGYVCVDRWRRARRGGAGADMGEERKRFSRLHARAEACAKGAAWSEVLETYESLSGALFDAIDRRYGIGARSYPRAQLREMLVDERGLNDETWRRVSALLEYAEMVRFAISAGATSEAAARSELPRWVSEGEAIAKELAP